MAAVGACAGQTPSSTAAPTKRLASLTEEQRLWLYTLAEDVEKGVQDRPSSASMCTQLGKGTSVAYGAVHV